MYSTCLFCNGSLGHNEAIEEFPVGRRLAFDAARGRLWVVCRRCARWNLTPLEERWEAIESCERAFRDTRLRVSTDEIGLAKLREGLELVRIGAPQRPEMAAWRYGDQFGRRTRRNVLVGAGVMTASVAVLLGAPLVGLGSFIGGLGALMQGGAFLSQYRRPIARVRVGTGQDSAVLKLAHVHVVRTTLRPEGPEGWSLEMPFLSSNARVIHTMEGTRYLSETVTLTGAEARHALMQILPHLNDTVRARTVQEAVGMLETSGTADEAFHAAALLPPSSRWNGQVPQQGRLFAVPTPVRLALEMAVHEESERRAMEGELHELEAAWRDAEEIAGIADDMFLPAGIGDALARLKHNDRQ